MTAEMGEDDSIASKWDSLRSLYTRAIMVLMPIGNEHYSFASFIAKEINNVALSLILTQVELQKDQ